MNADLLSYYQGTRDDRLITCVSLSHGANTYYYSDEKDDFTANIDGVSTLFEARSLTATRPARSGNGVFDADVNLDDVDLLVSPIIDAAVDAGDTITCVVYLYLESHQGLNYARKLAFTVENVSRQEETITLACKRPNIKNIRWPKEVYTVDKYPGLEAV